MDRRELDELSREELIALAERAGVSRPRVLTKPELVDEIVSRSERSPKERARARGWLGRARDLLAKVVEKGFHLPEAAEVLRGGSGDVWPTPPPPLPTVTLAEIYAAQGHVERAIETLDHVLAREPDHADAKALRERLVAQLGRSRPPPPPPVEEEDEERAAEEDVTQDATEDAGDAATAAPDDARGDDHHGLEPAEAEAGGLLALEDGELPERYEVDEIVGIAVDPRTLYVYWEVKPTTLARARAAKPSGALAMRLTSVSASWEGPQSETRDVVVDELAGDRFLRDVTPGANLRVSIGWVADGAFEPFAVGLEVTAPRVHPTESVAHAFGQWSPSAVAPFVNPDPSGASAVVSGPRSLALPTQRTTTRVTSNEGALPWAMVDGVTTNVDVDHARNVEVVEEVRRKVFERFRNTGASERMRELFVTEERDRRERPLGRGPLGGASERVRHG